MFENDTALINVEALQQSPSNSRQVHGVVPSPLETKQSLEEECKESNLSESKKYIGDTGTQLSQKSKVTSLIEQSSKAYLENKII